MVRFQLQQFFSLSIVKYLPRIIRQIMKTIETEERKQSHIRSGLLTLVTE